jgi:hypothetical protein
MCPVRIPHATATTTTAGETCVSIVRPMNAHIWARCGSPLLRLFPAYMILGMARSEAETRWTAQSAKVEPPKRPASPLWPTSILLRSPCGCGSSVCLAYLPCEEGNTFRLCYPIYATSGCCVTGTDSPSGEIQDCQGTKSPLLLPRIIDTECRSIVKLARALFSLKNRSFRSKRSRRPVSLGKSGAAAGPVFRGQRHTTGPRWG